MSDWNRSEKRHLEKKEEVKNEHNPLAFTIVIWELKLFGARKIALIIEL
jgi:hypothetical protein